MDPLTIGTITGLTLVSQKVAEKVLEKLVGDSVDKTWTGRENLAAIFRKYAYGELQTLELSEKYTPDQKTIRGEIDKLSDFLRRNEEALREIAVLLGESMTPNFGEFAQYRELENYRAKLKEKFTAEIDDLKQLRISAEIETATGQIEQLKKTIIEFAETITKIPHPSEKQIEARELFFAGKLDEARIRLEDSREEMQDIKTRALEAKDRNEAERIKIDEKLEELANDYLLLAQATAANFSNPDRLEDTCGYFEDSIECRSSFDNLFAHARFLHDHNLYQRAIILYQRIRKEFLGEISEENYAVTLNNLGILHRKTQKFATAEKEFDEALVIWRPLAETNPSVYEPYVAMTLNNLGILRGNMKEFATAEIEFSEALAIYRRLAKANPATYQPHVAMTLNNFGNLHKNMQEFLAAEKEYDEALAINRRLAKADSAIYEPNVALTLNNLGILHADTHKKFAVAEIEFHEALVTYRRLAEANPAAYEPLAATTLNNLGNLHLYTQEFAAEKEYLEALAIRRRLAEANPAAYEPDVASTFHNLGNLHANMKKFAESELEYSEALAIYRRLAEANPGAYKPDVAMTLINLAIFYSYDKPDRERSVELAQEAVIIITPYIERAPYTREYLEKAQAVLAAWEERDK